MLVVFIGPPGAGKGTQSFRLARQLGVPQLSTGDLFRREIQQGSDTGRLAAEFIDRGKLVPDSIVMEMVSHALASPEFRQGCLFDGFPRTLVQAASLDSMLQGQGTPLDVALELAVDRDELTRRMLARATREHRSDDTPETIRERFDVYYRQTTPLLKYYREQGLLSSVDGLGTPDEVFERILACMSLQSKR